MATYDEVYALMAGAHGCIWGGAMPHETVKLYNLVRLAFGRH